MTVSHGLSSTEVSQIIGLNAVMVNSSSNTSPIVYANAQFSMGVTYNVLTNGNISFYYDNAFGGGLKVYVTIEYYK